MSFHDRDAFLPHGDSLPVHEGGRRCNTTCKEVALMGFEIGNGVLKKYTEEPGVFDVIIPDNLTLTAPAGSYAQAYAKEHRISFVAK